MSIGTLLVLLGFIIAVIALVIGFNTRYGAYQGRALAVAVALVSFGVLLGADPLIKK